MFDYDFYEPVNYIENFSIYDLHHLSVLNGELAFHLYFEDIARIADVGSIFIRTVNGFTFFED